jgi:hypothetical protein
MPEMEFAAIELPPENDPINDQLVAYLQQLIKNPSNPQANPKGLRYLVAFFDDEGPRGYIIPGMKYVPKGWVGGPSDDIPCKMLKRADTALSVIFVDENDQNVASGWVYAAGRHGRAG